MLTTPCHFILLAALSLPSLATADNVGSPGKGWWIAHAFFMMIAFGFLFPYGTLIAVYRRKYRKGRSFYPSHRNFQLAGLAFMFFGFVWGAIGSKKAYGTGNPFASILWDFEASSVPWNHHVKYGVTVIVMACIQAILGYWSHLVKENHDLAVANANLKPGDAMTWKRPYFPSWLHVLFGMATILIGYITLFQGLQIFNFIFTGTTKVGGGLMVAYVIVNLSATGCLIAYLWEKYSTCD
jgi:hypothetical protein